MINELYHHGILGMHWGVIRKRDNSSGSNKNKSNAPKQKSKHQLALEEKYKSQGYSSSASEVAAKRRIRVERALAITAGVTVAAATAYVVSNHLQEKCDSVIKSTEHLQRIEYSPDGKDLHDVFYVAKDNADKTKYKGLLGSTRKLQTGKAYIMDLESTKDIKVAGRDRAIKEFGDLYKKDDAFRNSVEKYAGMHFSGKNVGDTKNISSKNLAKMYDNFNSNLVDIRYSGNGADKTFYDKLKSAGYGAIQDVNDRKFSGYNAKNPLIIFGQKDNVMVNSFKELDDSEIGKALVKDGLRETGKQLVKLGVMVLPVATIKSYASDFSEVKNGKQSKKTTTYRYKGKSLRSA